MATTTLKVAGMTCAHCVSTVTKELEALDRVTSVAIELHSAGSSVVTVSHGSDVGLDQLAGAIAKAGYTLEAVTARS